MTEEEATETEGELLFVDNVTGGRIPKNYIPAIEKGFRNMLAKGPVAGLPRGGALRWISTTARSTRWTARTWRS